MISCPLGRWVAVSVVLLADLSSGASLAGQSREVWLGVMGGAAPYDLSGTGTAPFVGARVELMPVNLLLIEPGLTYLTFEDQSRDRVHQVFPEVQALLLMPGQKLRLYLGAGGGWSLAASSGRTDTDLTLTAEGYAPCCRRGGACVRSSGSGASIRSAGRWPSWGWGSFTGCSGGLR